MKTCPRCNQTNFEIARRCVCGFDFITGAMGPPSGFSTRQGKINRTILAFLTAPLAGPMGIFIGYVLLDIIRFFTTHQWRTPEYLWTLLILYVFATPFVYFFSFAVGAPMYLLLKALNWLNKPALLAGSVITGTASIPLLFDNWTPNSMGNYIELIPYALGGYFVGSSFWKKITRDKLKQSV